MQRLVLGFWRHEDCRTTLVWSPCSAGRRDTPSGTAMLVTADDLGWIRLVRRGLSSRASMNRPRHRAALCPLVRKSLATVFLPALRAASTIRVRPHRRGGRRWPSPGLILIRHGQEPSVVDRRRVKVAGQTPVGCHEICHGTAWTALHGISRLRYLRPAKVTDLDRRDDTDVGNGSGVAHNPEVAGSNPAPATNARGRIRTRIWPLVCCLRPAMSGRPQADLFRY